MEMTVQPKFSTFMAGQPLLANTTRPPLDQRLPNPKAKLKDQFHEVARFKHLSSRTETTYWEWVVRNWP
jgi:hypothetical protein